MAWEEYYSDHELTEPEDRDDSEFDYEEGPESEFPFLEVED